MSLARYLGVDDLESPLLAAARESWRRWCAEYQALAVVEDLSDLPTWTRGASRGKRGAVLSKLAALTATDTDAVTALVWLLVPGAIKVADGLRDLHPDIDGLVAGQLWTEVACAHEINSSAVAATILRRTRREVSADLGVGDLAKRRDRAWAEGLLVESCDLEAIQEGPEPDLDPWDEVVQLEMDAMTHKAITPFDAILIDELARTATRLGVRAGRPRLGLTSNAVVDAAAMNVHLSPRAIRRRAAIALDRLAEFIRVRNDPDLFPAWRAQHPTCVVTPAEELRLVIDDVGDAQFFRVRDLPPGASGPDLAQERRPPASA